MADDEYEILPHQELEYLRHEVERLKRNPLGDTQASVSLLDSIAKLNENVERLVRIFESANDEMVALMKDSTLQDQLHRLRQENEKIANGIVALSRMLERLDRPPEPKQQPNPFEEQIDDDEVPPPPPQ